MESKIDKTKYFSASDLVKKSALQIRFLRMKREEIITWRMRQGIEYQNKVAAELKSESAQEFRTTVNINGLTIFACHDIITPDCIVEVKSINQGSTVEDWYLQNSLLQVAFYQSLLKLSDGIVFTPKFRIKEGYRLEKKIIDTDMPYLLKMGDEFLYEVTTTSPEKIIEYFCDKAECTLKERCDCMQYDKVHKHKHYEECKEFFKYKKLENIQIDGKVHN